MYINFGSINSRQAADGSCTAPLTVDSCGTCRLKKHASLPTITRYDENAYQLFYIAAGKAHFWFDDAEHVVTAGHMVLYRPQEERRYIYYLEDYPEVFWVYFSGSEAAAVLQAHEIPLDGHVFYSGIMPEYKNTFRRMIQELQLCQYAYRDYTAGLFQMMLVLVSRQRQERRSINGTTREQIEAAAARGGRRDAHQRGGHGDEQESRPRHAPVQQRLLAPAGRGQGGSGHRADCRHPARRPRRAPPDRRHLP